MRQLLKIALLLAIVLQLGCITTVQVGGYQPHVRPIKQMDYEVIGEISTFTSNFNLLWLFNVTPYANFDKAIENAINQKNGDEIIDVSWWLEQQYWIVGTINIIHIKGKVIKYK